jgi:Raf kinase inhibitor-like YbhB/YbcL family protein
MFSIRRLNLLLAALVSAACVSAGCSSDITPPATGNAGRDGGAGTGGAAGKDAAAGTGAAGTGDGAAGTGAAGTGDGAAGTGDAAPTDVPAGETTDTPVGDGAMLDRLPDVLPADAISPEVMPTDGPMSMTLTSAALPAGTAFPAVHTCAGANTSPPLMWTAGPTGTMSYAVSLTDLSINAVHWVIWDLPMGTTALPAALPGDTTLTTPVMAKQLHKVEFFGAGGAYRGPCPSGNNHIYQFEVNAIPTAALAGVTATSTVEQVKAAVQAASLAHGDLLGTSNASPPPADGGGQ